jgi:hypothetical protein
MCFFITRNILLCLHICFYLMYSKVSLILLNFIYRVSLRNVYTLLIFILKVEYDKGMHWLVYYLIQH